MSVSVCAVRVCMCGGVGGQAKSASHDGVLHLNGGPTVDCGLGCEQERAVMGERAANKASHRTMGRDAAVLYCICTYLCAYVPCTMYHVQHVHVPVPLPTRYLLQVYLLYSVCTYECHDQR